MVNNYILTQVKKWLRHEVRYNQEIVDAKDNKQAEICSDGTDDISYGRHECALGLLNQIKKWEKETADTPQKEWVKGYKKWKNEEVHGQQEQEELNASYKQSLANKKEREKK